MSREIEASKLLSCSRVPQVFETGTINDTLGDVLWLREAMLQGDSLRKVLQCRQLSPQEVQRLALHLLETLKQAEELRIVHRDVKPENVFMDVGGDFWLLDFGFARHLDLPGLTRASYLYGPCTPGYAPPEQFRNRQDEIDSRADLFAVAVTLFESHNAFNPYLKDAVSAQDIFRRVETLDLPRLELPLENGREFGDLVQVMGKRRRDHRPQSVAEAYYWLLEILA